MGLNLDSLKKMPALDDKQKGMLKLVGFALVGLIILIIIISILKGISGQRLNDEQLKNTMLRAAKQYVASHEDELPKDIYGEYEITMSTLISKGYMKEITKYKGKDTKCSGSVFLYYNDGNYSYSARLKNCDSDEEYVSLKDVITNEDNIVEVSNGLYYSMETNKYTYKGEAVDNYVSFANQLWRIISVEEDGNIKLIQETTKTKTPWDNRYNIDKRSSIGINRFEATESSRIKEQLSSFYNDDSIFESTMRSVIVPREYCIGARESSSYDKEGYEECSNKSEYMGAGSVTVSEVINASLDVNCEKTYSASCGNYNFFSELGSFWTITPNAENSYEVFVCNGGTIISSRANASKKMLAVVTINGDVEYKSGNGTQADPYMFKIEG